nr:HNH endonuclease family protein [Photobacterium damselae]
MQNINGIVKNLSSRDVSIGLEEYTIHHWTTNFAYTSKRNLYKAFKKQWDAGNITAEGYLQELYDDSKSYIKIISPLATDWPQADQAAIYNSLSALRIFNVSIMRSFLLSLFKARARGVIRQSQLIDTLKKIENFHFMFNSVCSLRPSGIEGLYAKSARSLSNAQNTRDARGIINDLLTKLDTKKPTQENFTDKFSKLKFINGNTAHKKLIQYIFVKLERSLRNNNEFEPSDLSLEHIMGQSTTGVSPEIIGSIGNLLPLGQGLNGNANVRDFPAKKQVYQQSDYRVVSDFLTTTTQDTWTEDDIIARTEALATHAYNTVWGN